MNSGVALLILTLINCLHFTNGKIKQIPIPDELQQCYNLVRETGVDEYVGSLYSWFCEHLIRNSSYVNGTVHINNATAKYYKEILDSVYWNDSSKHRSKRQALPPCVRKEYRMLTLDERRRYHNAVNALKRDTALPPNTHDAFGNVHTGQTNNIAHGGPGFLGWHRIFLYLYESNLRRMDPTVCLPYWDSTLDSQLPIPSLSSLWTADYLGTARGPLVSGPFAGWRFPNGAQIIRNVGVDGQLIYLSQIQNVLSRNSYAEIVFPTASNVFNFEIIHGGPHVYVGGSMSVLNTAAFDPVFYLHHAYIDYIFERFRARLRSIGVNPETYPQVNTNALHQANAPTGFQVPQSYGYLEVLARTASYQPVPTCSFFSRSCGDRYLVCQLSTGRCIPTTGGPRKKRSVEEPDQPPKESEPETCDKEPTYGLPYQNDYCEGNTCNTSQWAIIPVRIVNVRPPKFQTYNSYPVSGGQVDQSLDIYAPAAYNQTRQYIASQQGNPMTYSRCQHDEPAGQIFVYSHGINYAGYYKESTIVDQKLPVSVSLGFVGVKKPSPGRDGVTKVLLRAHDSCGRVCQVACKDPYTNQFKICSGAVAVTTDKPLMFGYTLDEAVTSVVDYKFDSECPRILGDNVFIMFLCDYRNQYPYVKYKPESN